MDPNPAAGTKDGMDVAVVDSSTSTPEDQSVVTTDSHWLPLMGNDLLIKSFGIRTGSSNNNSSLYLPPFPVATPSATDDDDDNHNPKEIHHGDVVVVDLIGRHVTPTMIPDHIQPNFDDSSSILSSPARSAQFLLWLEQHYHMLPTFHMASQQWIVVGEQDAVAAVELGVRFMHVGESAIVYSQSKYVHGLGIRQYHGSNIDEDNDKNDNNRGAYTLPPNAPALYELHVHHVWPAFQLQSSSSLDHIPFQIQVAQQKRLLGNDIYACEWVSTSDMTVVDAGDEPKSVTSGSGSVGDGDGGYGKIRAKQQYQRGADLAEACFMLIERTMLKQQEQQQKQMTESDNDSDSITGNSQWQAHQDEARQCLLDCLNNIVALHLRSHDYHAAKLAAVKVLQEDPHNLKALVRAAKAALLDPASSYDEVDAALQAAINERKEQQQSHDSSNNDHTKWQAELIKLQHDFVRRKRVYEQRTKAMYSKMLQSPTPTSKTSTIDASSSQNTPFTNKNLTGEADQDKMHAISVDDNNHNDPATAAISHRPWWKRWEIWRDRILPYGFQISLTIIMMVVFLQQLKQQHQQMEYQHSQVPVATKLIVQQQPQDEF